MSYPPPDHGQYNDPNQNHYGQYNPYSGDQTPPPSPMYPSGPSYPVTGPPPHPMTGGPAPMGPAYGHPMLPPMPGERPQQVTVAGFAILGMAAVLLISGGLGMVALRDNIPFAPQIQGLSAIYIVIAAGYVALSIGVQRGRQGARITSFVLFGLFLVCTPFSLFGGNGGLLAYEPWFRPLSTILNVVQLVLLIATIVLLAVPQSTAWFRAYNDARKAGLMR